MRLADLLPKPSFWALTRASVREFLAYPADVFMEFFTYPVVFFSYYCFLQALSKGSPQASVFPLKQLAVYYSLGWLLRMIFHQQTDLIVSGLVARGDIVQHLLRPVNFSIAMRARALGRAGARLLVYSLPAFLLMLGALSSFRTYLPANPLLFLAFALAGFLILFELQFLIGCIAFYTTMNFQISWTLDMLIRLCSGLVVPLAYFPAGVSTALGYTPLPYIYSVPIQAWISPGGTRDWRLALLTGAGWIVALYWINRGVLKSALTRLSINGG